MTSPRPDEFDIPSHFQHWPGDNAEDSIGPFFYFMEDGDSCTAFRAQPRNCNSHGSAHGGVLMAFADYTLCIAANGGAHQSVVTVSQNNEFIAPVHAGDLISVEERWSEAAVRSFSYVVNYALAMKPY